MNINHILTETYIDNIDIKSLLEHQIQQKGMKDPGLRFDKIISMTLYYKTDENISISNVNFPRR